MDERCSGEVAFVTRCFHWWYFISFYFLVVISHFRIRIPQPTWNCMSYKERSEPHCTLSPNAIPSQVNTVLRAKINILLPWSTAEQRQISFPYPLYSTELLIDPNSQRQSTYFTCLVQKLCFQEKSLLVLTYHNDKNNICGGKKTCLETGCSAGFGVFGLNWSHYHGVQLGVSLLCNIQDGIMRMVTAQPCWWASLPQLVYLVTPGELFTLAAV